MKKKQSRIRRRWRNKIHMAVIENLNIDKQKALIENRDKIIELIIKNRKKYLKEEIFEELCNNDELTFDDIDNL